MSNPRDQARHGFDLACGVADGFIGWASAGGEHIGALGDLGHHHRHHIDHAGLAVGKARDFAKGGGAGDGNGYAVQVFERAGDAGNAGHALRFEGVQGAIGCREGDYMRGEIDDFKRSHFFAPVCRVIAASVVLSRGGLDS